MEKSDRERAQEVQFMSDTMVRVVKLLNLSGDYLAAEVDSPVEDQLEAALRDEITRSVASVYGDEIVMGLITLLHRTADANDVQQFLADLSTSLQEEADELNARWEKEHGPTGND